MENRLQWKRLKYIVLGVLAIACGPYILGLIVALLFPVIGTTFIDLTQLPYVTHYLVGLVSLIAIVDVLGILYAIWLGGKSLYNYLYGRETE